MKRLFFLFSLMIVTTLFASGDGVNSTNVPPSKGEGVGHLQVTQTSIVEPTIMSEQVVVEGNVSPVSTKDIVAPAQLTPPKDAPTPSKEVSRGAVVVTLSLIWSNFIQLFFLFCPFFVLNMFLSLTEGATALRKRWLARRVFVVILVVGAISYFAGNAFLNLFGLNIEGFRIGAGILLMSMALGLAMGSETPTAKKQTKDIKNIVVVPLGIPIIMGPACVSPIVIIGAERMQDASLGWVPFVLSFLGFVGAMVALCLILYFADAIERLCGKTVIRIFSKLSGIILMAIAAQMIAKGFMAFLDQSIVGQKILETLG